MNDIDKAVARIVAAYEAAVLAKDAAALLRLYDPQARVFDAWGVWSYEGAEAWLRAVEGWLGSLGTERVKVRFEDARTLPLGREDALFTAIACHETLSPQGAVVRGVHHRVTWVLRLSGHVLRIAHEHTSTPIAFDGSGAILRRDEKA